ncbi:molybdate ABC transporter substrate-binding protein [bacterium]|nr:molybdate ABC transporter substrate-binding protein [bacterium]
MFSHAFLIIFFIAYLAKAENKITVFAPASTTEAITEISKLYQKQKKIRVVTAFASTSTLAKQIEAGANADIFLAADLDWMKHLQTKNKISKSEILLKNTLVLVCPAGKSFPVKMEKGFDFAGSFSGKIALGDPSHVPAGIYGKEALIFFGWWEPSRVVGAFDVRSALKFVELGEVPLGIVYQTDAKISKKVEILAVFPEESHTKIVYPVGIVKNANVQANGFFDFLFSKEAKAIFQKYGFSLAE